MPTEKQIVAFKLGARARKLLSEGCVVEGYELLYGAIAEARASEDAEMVELLQAELDKYDRKAEEG